MMQGMGMFPQMMFPQMMPQMSQMAQMAQDESSGDEEPKETPAAPVEERQALPEASVTSGDRITTSATFLRQVGRGRLSEGMEWISPSLDTTMTHQLTSAGLLALLYLCTKLRPSTKICDLRGLTVLVN